MEVDCQPYAPDAFMSMKNPMTPAGIEPAAFRFVAQHLNHCSTAVPFNLYKKGKFFAVRAMETSRRSISIVPLTPNLSIRGRWVGNLTRRPLYSREIAPVASEQATGWVP